MDSKYPVFIFSTTTDSTMITFISSKVSDRQFTLKSKVKNLPKTRNANFSFSVY